MLDIRYVRAGIGSPYAIGCEDVPVFAYVANENVIHHTPPPVPSAFIGAEKKLWSVDGAGKTTLINLILRFMTHVRRILLTAIPSMKWKFRRAIEAPMAWSPRTHSCCRNHTGKKSFGHAIFPIVNGTDSENFKCKSFVDRFSAG
jgi:hypothetical protein